MKKTYIYMHVQYENITETLSIQERERKQNGIIESERRANSPFTCKMWKIVDVYTPSWRLKNHPCNKKQQSKHTGENIHPWMVRMRIVDAFVDFRCNKLRRASIYLVLSKPGKFCVGAKFRWNFIQSIWSLRSDEQKNSWMKWIPTTGFRNLI